MTVFTNNWLRGDEVVKNRISVITAALNAGSTLGHCLDSVFFQQGVDLEHIVVDGNSTDNSIGLLKSLHREQLRWISEPDQGIANAMNKGISMSRGEWLYFLQADDFLVSVNSLAGLLERASPGTDIISGSVRVHSPSQGSRVFRTRGWSIRTPFKTTIPHQGALIKRGLFDTLGLYDETLRVAMDYDWFLAAYWKQVSLKTAPILVAEMSGGGISSKREWNFLNARFLEEKRIHFKRAPSVRWRGIYHLYWSAYYPYRRARFRIHEHAGRQP